jgi:chemotaxis protein histidine kinase CheA
MATVRDYFREESTDCLRRFEEMLAAEQVEPASLHRLSRTLRGVAQMAREERAYRAAVALEAATRAVARGELAWDHGTRDRFRTTVEDLGALVHGEDSENTQEARVASVLDRWLGLGIVMPEREIAGPAPSQDPVPGRRGEDAFRAFVAREVAAIAGALDAGVDALLADPLDREPLRAILRRQRILLGAARLDELPVVPEALRAVEDISRVIARLDIAIKDEWLDVFRSAREVMRAAAAALDRGDEPHHINALSRLRTLHTELIERYGAAEAAPETAAMADVLAQAHQHAAAPHVPVQPVPEETEPAQQAQEAAGPAQHAELDIADLMYDRDAAVRRVAELRPRIERAVGDDGDARAALDELFDLIRSLSE